MTRLLRLDFGILLAGWGGGLGVILGVGARTEPEFIGWGAAFGAIWGASATLVREAEREGLRLIAVLLALAMGGVVGYPVAGPVGGFLGGMALLHAAVLWGEVEAFVSLALISTIPLAVLGFFGALWPPPTPLEPMLLVLSVALASSHLLSLRGMSFSSALTYLAIGVGHLPLVFLLMTFKVLRALRD